MPTNELILILKSRLNQLKSVHFIVLFSVHALLNQSVPDISLLMGLPL